MILTGATAGEIEAAVRGAKAYRADAPEICRVHSLLEAVQLAHKKTCSGEVVLLSPACASFDAFKNFEERGETFRKAVNEL